jgi:MHS family shikimate/dehydroshikimate transporter-like MFS transporter
VDWYDFYLYGTAAALVFSHQFFPTASPVAGTLAAFATFAVGFMFRPLGGIVFGHFGDRLGRKRMLVLTMLIMGIATASIGVLPSYASIGVWAPVLLTVLRAVQGFAVGGEWGGAALMAVESAPPKWKTLYSSGVQVGASVGLLIATSAIALTSGLLSHAAFDAWGWRIPFVLSIVIVGIGLLVRARVEESPEFLEVREASGGTTQSVPLLTAIRQHPTAFLTIIGLRLPELLTFFIVTTFALSYGTTTLGLSRDELLPINIVVGAIAIATIPTFAYAADRWGRRRVYICAAAIGAIGAIPFFLALESGSLVLIYLGAIVLVNLAHDLAVSVQQPLFTEMFGTSYRYSGAGVGYQVASAVGGGFTPLIATALVAASGGSWAFVAVYLVLGCLVALVLAWRLPTQPRPAPAGDRATAGPESEPAAVDNR